MSRLVYSVARLAMRAAGIVFSILGWAAAVAIFWIVWAALGGPPPVP
jgi:hypothetical protein